MPLRRPAVLAAGLALLAVIGAGCATGQRPTLGSSVAIGGGTGEPVGDEAVDSVLRLLEGEESPTYTARYRLTRKLGATQADGTVVRDGDQRSITVGDIRFLVGPDERTCNLATGECEDGVLEARISDVGVATTFYGPSPARALRVAFERRSGPPVAGAATVGGLQTTCVDVPVGGGVERYCAAPGGQVALWDTAATNVELVSQVDTADPAAFTIPGG
jgi:hypothetical protein